MGIKGSDLFTLPLCRTHHQEQHSVGALTFAHKYGLNCWRERALLMERFFAGVLAT